jgi:hypothetical protein
VFLILCASGVLCFFVVARSADPVNIICSFTVYTRLKPCFNHSSFAVLFCHGAMTPVLPISTVVTLLPEDCQLMLGHDLGRPAQRIVCMWHAQRMLDSSSTMFVY